MRKICVESIYKVVRWHYIITQTKDLMIKASDMYWARLKNEFQAADTHRLMGNTAPEPKTIAVAHDTRPSRRLSGLYRLCVVFCSV